MTSTLFVEEIKGRTTGTNANKVIVPSGQTLEVPTVTGNPSFTGGLKVNTVQDTTGTTGITVNAAGFVSRPQTPCVSATKNSSGQQQTISGTNYYVVTNLDSSYGNSHSVNNKSYFDSSTSRFTVPIGQPSGYYLCSFHTLLGIEIPSSGTNWGYIAIRKNDSAGLSNNHITEAYREVVNATAVSAWSWETLNCTALVHLNAGQYVEPIFSGSAGIDIYIHSGNYTNFTVAQIG